MPKGGGNGGGNGGGGSGGSTISGNKRDNSLVGTAADETILGLDGNDYLSGLGGADLLDGGDGNDTLIGGDGDDSLLGGLGVDEAVFTGLVGDYEITQIDATTVMIAGPDGTDLVSDVEVFTFGDVTLTFDELVNPPDGPNLTAGGPTVATTEWRDGDTVTVDWLISNIGDVEAASTGSGLYISTDATITTADTLLGTDVTGLVAAGGSAAGGATFTLSGLAPGTYWIGVIADDADTLAESDEMDNVSNAVQITILPALPNAVAASMVATPSAPEIVEGQAGSLQVDYTVANAGLGQFGQGVSLTVILSADAAYSVDDTVIQTTVVADLAGGQSFADVASIALPTDLAPGTYHVGIAVDLEDALAETDETDNILFAADTITIVADPNTGTAGADVLAGSAGDDTIDALGGDDTVLGSTGSDWVDGGDGFDLIDYSGAASGIDATGFWIDFLNGTGLYPVISLVDGSGSSTVTGVEALRGSEFDDQIELRGGLVSVDGGGGNDSIRAAMPNVTIAGGDGDDFLSGSGGADVLSGDAGNDTINAGAGDDLISTGAGSDIVGATRVISGSVTAGEGHDVVTDFDAAMDVIWFGYYPEADAGFDPFLLITQTVDGARIDYADDSSLLLNGVDAADLTSANVVLIALEGTGAPPTFETF